MCVDAGDVAVLFRSRRPLTGFKDALVALDIDVFEHGGQSRHAFFDLGLGVMRKAQPQAVSELPCTGEYRAGLES